MYLRIKEDFTEALEELEDYSSRTDGDYKEEINKTIDKIQELANSLKI